jgi:hypothetical protein
LIVNIFTKPIRRIVIDTPLIIYIANVYERCNSKFRL